MCKKCSVLRAGANKQQQKHKCRKEGFGYEIRFCKKELEINVLLCPILGLDEVTK